MQSDAATEDALRKRWMNGSRLSRFLSKVLRHQAIKRGLELRPDAFVPVEAVLRLRELRQWNCSLQDLQLVR